MRLDDDRSRLSDAVDTEGSTVSAQLAATGEALDPALVLARVGVVIASAARAPSPIDRRAVHPDDVPVFERVEALAGARGLASSLVRLADGTPAELIVARVGTGTEEAVLTVLVPTDAPDRSAEPLLRSVATPQAEMAGCPIEVPAAAPASPETIGREARDGPPAFLVREEGSLETIAEGVALWSVDDRGDLQPALVNSAMRVILGPDAVAVVASLAGIGRPPAIRNARGEAIGVEDLPHRITASTGKPVDGHLLGIAVPGHGERWVRAASRPVLSRGDRLSGVLLSMVDVTAEQAANRELEAAHARFAALVEHSADVITVLDGDGVVRYASPAYRLVYGEDPADRIGRLLVERIHPDDRGAFRAAFAALVATPEASMTTQSRLSLGVGAARHVEITATNHLDDPAVAGVVANSRDVTERVDAAARLAHQALHDPLTGLANRAFLEERLVAAVSRAERSGVACALLFLDLDHFKAVNDGMGHPAGDEVLIAVADLLAAGHRTEDLVCRLGGDEFVVLLEDVGTVGVAGVVAERLRGAVAGEIPVAGRSLRLTASIGIALSDGCTPQELMAHADEALYQAKAQGRDRCVSFAHPGDGPSRGPHGRAARGRLPRLRSPGGSEPPTPAPSA